MPRFEMEVSLPVSKTRLFSELLNMSGVNYELGPLLKMSVPPNWYSKPIPEWPINKTIFSSKVLLMGFLPIDLHHFKFVSVSSMGFKESSKTLINSVWSHERIISGNGSFSKVKDIVYFKSKLGFLGYLFKPLYKSIFSHRHKRLKSKYAIHS